MTLPAHHGRSRPSLASLGHVSTSPFAAAGSALPSGSVTDAAGPARLGHGAAFVQRQNNDDVLGSDTGHRAAPRGPGTRFFGPTGPMAAPGPVQGSSYAGPAYAGSYARAGGPQPRPATTYQGNLQRFVSYCAPQVSSYVESTYSASSADFFWARTLGNAGRTRPSPSPLHHDACGYSSDFSGPSGLYELLNPFAQSYGHNGHRPRRPMGPPYEPAGGSSPFLLGLKALANGVLRTVQCLMGAAALACAGLLGASCVAGMGAAGAQLLPLFAGALGGLVLVGGVLALLAWVTRHPCS